MSACGIRAHSSVPVSASLMPPACSDELDTGCATGCAKGCAKGADAASSPTTWVAAGAASWVADVARPERRAPDER